MAGKSSNFPHALGEFYRYFDMYWILDCRSLQDSDIYLISLEKGPRISSPQKGLEKAPHLGELLWSAVMVMGR